MHGAVAILLLVLSTQTSSALADGVAALNNGDAARAVALLEQAVASQPTSSLALLHLANAQRVNRRPDEAAATLKRALQLNPNNTLVLWNLGVLPRDEGVEYLRQLTAIDPSYPHALTALASLQTMHARTAYRNAKRSANVRAEDQEWIGDAAIRSSLRAAAGAALDEAQDAAGKARASDPTAFEPIVFAGLVLRMQAEFADTPEQSKQDIVEADRLTAQSMVLRRQQTPSPQPAALDPTVSPPPFPAPGAPPPPPPK